MNNNDPVAIIGHQHRLQDIGKSVTDLLLTAGGVSEAYADAIAQADAAMDTALEEYEEWMRREGIAS